MAGSLAGHPFLGQSGLAGSMPQFFRLLAACFLAMFLGLTGAAAQTVGEAASGISAGNFVQTGKAVDALAATGDPKALPVLQAMLDGKLQRSQADGRLVIEGKDALTGEPVTLDDLQPVRLNNQLRGKLRGAIGQFALLAADPAQRLAAVADLVQQHAPDSLARLEGALANEKDEGVAQAMRFGAALLALSGNDKPKQLQAIQTLSGSFDPRAQGVLTEAASNAPDADVKAAAQTALAHIERQRSFIDIAVNLYQGVSLGSILLLAAVGLAVTFGVAGVINMAHGEMLMLGAYTTFVVQQFFRDYLPASVFDWYLIAAIPAAAIVAGAVGMLIERGVIRFLYGRPLETLLATWGLSLILQQAVRSIFGPTNQEVANPAWMTGGFEIIGGVTLTYNRLVIIVFSMIVLAIVWFVLQRSRFGLEMRAVTQNRRMAAAVGIDTARVDALTFALGSAIAGMGGVALSQVGNVSPNLGTLYIVDSFMVVVFGGVGQLAGTVVGALSLGVLNKLLEPFAGAVLAKVLLLVLVILFIQKRPQGLFVLKGRSAEA